ncbi:MAG: hypothetical protein QNI91_08990 [Arenicellales bacterium]|nr:hypothetical protein [Arenicellales bacterium]
MINPRSALDNDTKVKQPSARRGRKWLFYGLGILFVLGLVTVLVPTILSTSWGRSMLVGVINNNVRGSVAIDTLSLSWFDGQSIRGVEILDPAGKTVGRLEEVSTELTLLNVMQSNLSLGRTTIRGLDAELVVDESGANNLTQALEPRQPSMRRGAAPVLIPITGNIELDDARMTVTTPHAEPALFEGLTGAMRIESAERMLNVGLQGRSQQGDRTGEFKITGQITDLIAPDGTLNLQTAKGNLEANVKDLPIDSIDGMFGLQGLLSAAAGESANLNIQASGTAQVQNLLITVDSPNIQAEIIGEINEDRFTLSQPASVLLNVTPSLFETLIKTNREEAALHLVEAFPLNLQAEQFNLSVTSFNLANVALRGGIEIGKPIQLTTHELGELVIQTLTAAVDSERVAESVTIKLNSEAVSKNESGRVDVQATLDQLFDQQGTLQLDKMHAEAVANFTNVPTLLIDQIARQNGQLVNLLGQKMGLSARVKSSGPDRIDGTLTVDAGPLKTSDITFSLTDSLVLTKPAEIHYLISPEIVRRMLGEDLVFGLQQPTEIALEIQAFSAPRPKAGEPIFQPTETKMVGSLVSERLTLLDIPNLGMLHIDNARLDLSADSLSSIQLVTSARVSEAESGLLAMFDASPLQVHVDTTTGLDTRGYPGSIDAQFRLLSQGVNSEANINVPSALDRVTLTAPASLEFVLTPGLLEHFGITSPNKFTLGKSTPIDIELSRLDAPLAAFSLKDLQATAALRFDELMLAGNKSMAGASLRNADVAVDYDGPSGSAKIGVVASTFIAGDEAAGSLKVDATAKRLLQNSELSLRTADVNATANIDSLPTALLGALSGQEALVPIVGDSMKVDMTVELVGDKGPGMIELKTQSRNLSVDAGFNFGDELELNRPADLRLTLTPDGYEALIGASTAFSETDQTPSGYELLENTTFETVIKTLRWPIAKVDGKSQFNPSRAALVAAATTPHLALRDRASGHTFSIEMFKLMLQGSDLSKPIDIEINGQIRDAQADPGQAVDAAGRLGVSGQAADVFTEDGQFNSDGLSLQLDGNLQKLPMALLDQLLSMEGLMVAALGNTADITLDTNLRQMVGPLNLGLQSTTSTFDIKARLDNEGLVLTEPLVAEVQVTPAIGKIALGKIHPIFETAQSSDQPLRLKIPREGVLIPIRDFDISKTVIPQMTLDLGNLILRSGWLLNGATGLAREFGALRSSEPQQWTALFTPAVLKMNDGKVTYERRLDLLLDKRLHLATWGTVDIANDRADLTLAFMPETLEKVFRLTAAANDALRIPIRGTLSRPSVDFGRAGLDLERLRQQQRLAEKDKLVGALVGTVAKTAIGGTPMPPASVDPLPWGSLPEPEGQAETEVTKDPTQPSAPASPKSTEQQVIEGLIGILKKKKE